VIILELIGQEEEEEEQLLKKIIKMRKLIIVILFFITYYSQAQFTGGNGRGYASATRASGSLPIELLSFSGKCENGKNILQWSTSSETNNDYFTIERTSDGIHDKIEFIIDGAGNSSQIISYSFVDENPKTENYYRLKQTDFDGKYEYFKYININCSNNNLEFNFNIFPNPI